MEMKTVADSDDKRLFRCSFTEYNGEQEYSYDKLAVAKDRQEAEEILLGYLKRWYCDEDAEPIVEDGKIVGYEFFAGCPVVRRGFIFETTRERFLKDEFEFALINKEELDDCAVNASILGICPHFQNGECRDEFRTCPECRAIYSNGGEGHSYDAIEEYGMCVDCLIAKKIVDKCPYCKMH